MLNVRLLSLHSSKRLHEKCHPVKSLGLHPFQNRKENVRERKKTSPFIEPGQNTGACHTCEAASRSPQAQALNYIRCWRRRGQEEAHNWRSRILG